MAFPRNMDCSGMLSS